jgi:WD40 repeat protein
MHAAVGSDRGVHYYAMQLVDGQTLAALVQRLQTSSAVANSPQPNNPPASGPLPDTDSFAAAGHSTAPSPAKPVSCRTVAGWGVQAAEALEYAHQMGVIHRDVKPGNLMVDGRGHLWVTDFGLARVASDNPLTVTGDVVGTLRYMSPEQAKLRRLPLDHRTDIYSLGVTLYELLTLRPAFAGQDRAELVRQIAEDDPPPPRRLNPAVPAELETVVLKALAKEPDERYQTAQELGDDLRRFLDDRPILARRPTLGQQVLRWARRHWAVVLTAVVCTLLGLLAAVVALAVGYAQVQHEKKAVEEERGKVKDALDRETTARERLAAALYVNGVALADRELQGNRVRRAEAVLEECPPDLRRWEWGYLERLCHTELSRTTLPSAVGSVAGFSLDGKRFVTLSDAGVPTVWETATNRELLQLPKHNPRSPIAFSADGNRLAILQYGTGTVTVWNVSTEDGNVGREVGAIAVPPLGVIGLREVAIAFSRDGQRLALAETAMGRQGSSQIHVWDLANKQRILSLKWDDQGLSCVAMSPQGKYVGVGTGRRQIGHRGRALVWDVQSGRLVFSTQSHTGAVLALAFSPDETTVVTASEDRTVKVWELDKSGQERFTLVGHGDGVSCVTFGPDGTRLATAGHDRSIKVWSAALGQELFTLRGHDEPVSRLLFSPDGRQLISVGADRTVRTWDATGSRNPLTLPGKGGNVTALVFDAAGRKMIAAGPEVQVWDAATWQTREAYRPFGGGVLSAAWGPGGKVLGVVQQRPPERAVRVVDVVTEAEVAALGELPPVTSAVFSPDARRLALAARGIVTEQGKQGKVSEVRLFDLSGAGQPLLLDRRSAADHVLAFSRDGRWLATSVSTERSVKVWETETGREVHTLTGHATVPRSLAFGGDDKLLAVGGWDTGREGAQDLYVWDLTTGREAAAFRGHPPGVTAVAFSPDSRRLISLGQDKTLKVWDVATGQELLSLPAPTGVSQCVFSPDGRYLITGDFTGVTMVWDGRPWDEKEARAIPPDERNMALPGNK